MLRNKLWILIVLIVVFAGVLVYGLTLEHEESNLGTPDNGETSIHDKDFAYGPALLQLGQTAYFPDVSVRPIRIIEDSRCPQGVQCIQAGRVRLETEVVSAMGTSTDIYEVGSSITTEAEVITLVSVDPYPKAGDQIGVQEYRVLFDVSKRVETPNPTLGKCYVGGCSGQICSDAPGVSSTCEYREAYGCYKTAQCERQSTGQCGWTETSALRICLNNAQ